MLRYVCFMIFLCLIGVPATPAGAAGIAEGVGAAHSRQLSHRAIYKLNLSPKSSPGNLTDIDGRMVMEWRETCDGFIAEQRIVTNSIDETGGKSVSDISATSWEALDGSSFRFSMRQRLDNELVQEYEGSAKLDAAGGGGVAALRKPSNKQIMLPAGIVFPTAHMRNVLVTAREGRRSDSRPLFDGTSESDYYQVVTSIGGISRAPLKSLTEKNVDVDSIRKAIGDLPWWPVQISYYGKNVSEGIPEFEIAYHLYDNGASSNVTLDYGAFALLGTLTRIEAYEPPDC